MQTVIVLGDKTIPHFRLLCLFVFKEIVLVDEETDMETAFHIFARHNISFLPVVRSDDPKTVVGQLKKTDLFAAYDQYVLKERLLPPMGWVCPLPPTGSKVQRFRG